jgi:hypothetical protein
MTRFCVTFATVFILCCSSNTARSQTPYLQIYFDSYWTQTAGYCPGYGVLDTLYVVADDLDAFITGIEFRVDYPAETIWVADFDTPPVTLGQTPFGISIAWAIPQNGYQPLLVAKVLIVWNCDDCSSVNIPLCPNVHPTSGYVRAVGFPAYDFIYAGVEAACICPACACCVCPEVPVPVEATTWSKIKELFQ